MWANPFAPPPLRVSPILGFDWATDKIEMQQRRIRSRPLERLRISRLFYPQQFYETKQRKELVSQDITALLLGIKPRSIRLREGYTVCSGFVIQTINKTDPKCLRFDIANGEPHKSLLSLSLGLTEDSFHFKCSIQVFFLMSLMDIR